MELLGVQKSALKQAAGMVAETLSRLKLHKRVTGDADLSQLLELESLAMGITGKAALWETLIELARTDTRLRGVDLQGLRVRAQEQLGAVRDEHRKVAAAAFAG